MSQQIRILQSYRNMPDAELIAAAGAVLEGKTGPAAELTALQTARDNLNAAIAAQSHGGAAATAHKKNMRDELIAILRRLAHYVQDNCGGDVAMVLKAGFAVATFGRTTAPLERPAIAGIDFGQSRELVIKVNPVARARCYEVQMAAIGVGGSADEWQRAGLFTNSRSMTVGGLTPGTTYAFQVRAIGGSSGSTDWSDSVARVCAY